MTSLTPVSVVALLGVNEVMALETLDLEMKSKI